MYNKTRGERMKKIVVDKEKLTEESRGLFKEFKEFISRGNVMDLAVGVIIGTAFSNIVTAFTKMLTDLIGTAFGGIDFRGLTYTIGKLTVEYGTFLQAVFDFLITAVCIFIMVKIVNRFRRKKEQEKTVTPPPTPRDIVLLEEIRDLLKENQKTKKTKLK